MVFLLLVLPLPEEGEDEEEGGVEVGGEREAAGLGARWGSGQEVVEAEEEGGWENGSEWENGIAILKLHFVVCKILCLVSRDGLLKTRWVLKFLARALIGP